VQVRRLTLADFRSYGQLETDFPAGPQVIVGPNAAGKTNLLEAIAVLVQAHSHRTSADQELISWGADFARLEACVSRGPGAGGDRSEVVEVVLVAPGRAPGARKRVKVNGVPRRPAALAATVRAVMFAPEDMLLVSGPPSLRRTVLDALVVQRTPAAGASLSTYGRALTQRNNLLRRIREGAAGSDELRFWDGILVTEGGRIVTWRLDTLADLVGPLAAAHAEITQGEGTLTLRYATNAAAAPGESPQDALRRRLAETSEKELWNGATLVGPHRDDLVFELDGRDLSGFASRGQQRTAILALKLAHVDLLTTLDGVPPLLLLDDVFSELDPDRRSHLVRRISGLPQAFVTTTTLADLDPALVAASTAWEVRPGRLERVAVP
jgi:DNA replication and repair protein RecF